MNLSKLSTYTKTVVLSALVGLSSCTKQPAKKVCHAVSAPVESTKAGNLLSMLERGDRHSVKLAKPSKEQVLTIDEISKYLPNDSTGQLFYQVYAGAADKAIRKARGKKGTLVTAGQGITGLNCIELAGGKKAYEGDFISAHSLDSMVNLQVKQKYEIIKNNVPDSVYKKMTVHEKDAITSYLYNAGESILKHSSNGKSFFEYLSEGNKGMAQSKFNVSASSKCAATGLAKRNLIQMIIFGDGEIYKNKAAQKNFKKQLGIVQKHENAQNLINEILDIVKKYGVNSVKLAETKLKMMSEK